MNTTHVTKAGGLGAVGRLTGQVTCSRPPAVTRKAQIQSLGQITWESTETANMKPVEEFSIEIISQKSTGQNQLADVCCVTSMCVCFYWK